MAELLVRVLGVGPEVFVVYSDMFRMSDDPALSYELVPGAPDGPDPISSAGLRDREFPEEKPEGVFRIGVIGDSVTFGYRVGRDQTYPKQLERLLNLCRTEGAPEFEVLNFGVIGYNAPQIAEVPRARVARFEPDCIIYGYVLNDPQSYSLEAEALRVLEEGWWGRHLRGAGRLLRHSRLYLLTRAVLTAQEEPWLLEEEPGFAAYQQGHFFDYLRALHERDESWSRVAACLSRLAEREEVGAPVIVATFPVAWRMESEVYPLSGVHEKVVGAARQQGLGAVDLTPAFDRVARAWDEVLFQDFLHPDERGHLVAALALLRTLDESDVVPAAWLRFESLARRSGTEGVLARIVAGSD